MNITGIIAEYNPFHNGHAYHLARAREETNADYILVIMSGNFVQRGAPALLDKFTRAKMALSEGADLVIELPALWSSASAEYYARANVALLNQLGCVDFLCYGCETPSHDLYAEICKILCSETLPYQLLLNEYLKTGSNYAYARAQAVCKLLPASDSAAAMQILKNPNNILALEYCKAIVRESAAIKTYPILRKGQSYHSKHLSGRCVSASAIRELLSSYPENTRQTLFQMMPACACHLLLDYQSHYPLLYEKSCSQMLHYCLLKSAADGFSHYADCTLDFSNKICKNINAYTGFSDFCTRLKSKNMTYTRISRILLHILLNIRQSDYIFWSSHAYVPYARILGFRKESRDLLTHLKKHTAIPLLTRAADSKKLLTAEHDAAFFQKHLFADSIYQALVLANGGQKMKNEFQQQIITV